MMAELVLNDELNAQDDLKVSHILLMLLTIPVILRPVLAIRIVQTNKFLQVIIYAGRTKCKKIFKEMAN
jgi:hypothetical protein